MAGGIHKLIAAAKLFGLLPTLLHHAREYRRNKRSNLNWASILEAEEAAALAEYTILPAGLSSLSVSDTVAPVERDVFGRGGAFSNLLHAAEVRDA